MTNLSAKVSLVNKSPKAIAEYLRSIGDEDDALRFTPSGIGGQNLFGGQKAAWEHTGIMLGYIAPEASNGEGAIQNATAIEPDEMLKNGQIKISLERFWVHSYPGRGKHQILCEFAGKNQIAGETEELRFALTTDARDESSAAVAGMPIFLGASVGKNGISFEGRTINVRSDDDETLIAALGSGPFKEGLSLLTTAQPALKPFVGLASSVVTAVLKRSRNVQVYYFKLGLDFAVSQTSAKLRLGSFVVIQGDEAGWRWDDYMWNGSAQQIVRRRNGQPIEYNYLIFRVSLFEQE